jgi:purine-binding chemotaxis protein CheW
MADTAVLEQFLAFTLAGETFALEVESVREVLEVIPITRVPRMPGFMSGVINVRGSVVPVIDLRVKFGMEAGEKTVSTCIVVLEHGSGNGKVVWGALVDAVQEVIEFEGSQVEPAPRVGTGMGNGLLRGIGKRGDRFVMILDLSRVFSGDELAELEKTGN